MKKIAIFASGTGTNAQRLMEHFAHHKDARISLIICNKEGAGVIERAERMNVPVVLLTKQEIEAGRALEVLREFSIDFIVLAGFLLKIPAALVAAYPRRIVNIHPALLPQYGGKGMYGAHVHEAVVAHGEKETGITIHYVNEHYDEGEYIFQARCTVLPTDTPDDVARKVHALEHAHFPSVVEQVLTLL